MNPHTLNDELSGQTSTPDDQVSGFGVLEDTQALWQALCQLIYDRLQLAALETQQAGRSLVVMLVAGMMVAGLLVCAWLGLLAAAVLGLVEHGMLASAAILFAVAFNLLLALILFGVIRRRSRYLKCSATLRSFKPAPVKRRDAQKF